VIRDLVESIEARNRMVKKLNASKRIRRADHDFIEEVSDDEVEVELPDLNTYSGVIDHTQANPAEAFQTIPSSTPATRANVITSDVVSGTADPTSNTIPPITKASPYIDFQSLGPIYRIEEVSKNKQQLDVTKLPNAILQMAYLKLYIPLSMLTTSALSKIRSNDGLKYHKIPFSNGASCQSLDKSIFPPESALSESLFLQAYRNWHTIIDLISSLEVAVGWYEHHAKMLQDQNFSASFEAWCSMDRQLHTQFIEDPFVVDPICTTYSQLFEQACMEAFLTCADKPQYGHSFRSNVSTPGG